VLAAVAVEAAVLRSIELPQIEPGARARSPNLIYFKFKFKLKMHAILANFTDCFCLLLVAVPARGTPALAEAPQGHEVYGCYVYVYAPPNPAHSCLSTAQRQHRSD